MARIRKTKTGRSSFVYTDGTRSVRVEYGLFRQWWVHPLWEGAKAENYADRQMAQYAARHLLGA